MIPPGSPDARRLLARAEAARDALHVWADELARREAAVRAAVDRLRAGRVAAALAAMPVDRLRDVAGAALRLAPLEDAGYRTVADVRTASVGALDAIDGVGAATATQAKAAAEQLAGAIADAEPVRLDPDARDEASSELLRALDTLARAQAQVRSVRGDLGRVVAALDDLVPAARPARGRLRFFFTRSAVKARARDALDGLAALVDEPETRRVVDVVASADRAALRPVSDRKSVV